MVLGVLPQGVERWKRQESKENEREKGGMVRRSK